MEHSSSLLYTCTACVLLAVPLAGARSSQYNAVMRVGRAAVTHTYPRNFRACLELASTPEGPNRTRFVFIKIFRLLLLSSGKLSTNIPPFTRTFPFLSNMFSWLLSVWISRYRYEKTPECAYDPARLNFAIHIRMGDRRAMLGESLGYFYLLEQFMDTVSKEVVRKGLVPPLFHVFSETLIPCPQDDTGIFDEFPSWPVHQVRK